MIHTRRKKDTYNRTLDTFLVLDLALKVMEETKKHLNNGLYDTLILDGTKMKLSLRKQLKRLKCSTQSNDLNKARTPFRIEGNQILPSH